jgi:hypothetical protein
VAEDKKKHLRGTYQEFLRSAAGQDLINHAEVLQKAYILQGMKETTSEAKAHSLCKAEGVVSLRDYLIRMAKIK